MSRPRFLDSRTRSRNKSQTHLKIATSAPENGSNTNCSCLKTEKVSSLETVFFYSTRQQTKGFQHAQQQRRMDVKNIVEMFNSLLC